MPARFPAEVLERFPARRRLELAYPGKHPAWPRDWEVDEKTIRALEKTMNAHLARNCFSTPLLRGHMAAWLEDDRPAEGWVLHFGVEKRKDGAPALWADVIATDDLGAQMADGRMPNRSVGVALQPDGSWYIQHVALLGATTPAVKDLAPPVLLNSDSAAADGRLAVVCCGGLSPVISPTPEKEDEMKIRYLSPGGGDGGQAPAAPAPTAPTASPELTALAAENAKLKADHEAQQKRLAELERQNAVAAFAAALAPHVAAGRVTPAQADAWKQIVGANHGLATQLTGPDGKPQTVADSFLAQAAAAAPQVAAGEALPNGQIPRAAGGDRAELDRKAKAILAKNGWGADRYTEAVGLARNGV